MKKVYDYSWQDGKRLTVGKKPLIMGILNGTPDSFSDGGKYNSEAKAVAHLQEMTAEGADIVDVGVESTRPGHVQISTDEEIRRMEEILLPVLKEAKVPISVDTYRAATADFALSKGAHILNDIWGLTYDGEIAQVAAAYRVPVIIMHNQKDEKYHDIIEDMKAFFDNSINIALKNGIEEKNIWLDPGIGFGKNVEQNIYVLQNLEKLIREDFPFLLAPSRKRYLGALLQGIAADRRDVGTLATCLKGYTQGVDIFRVHNVEVHQQGFAVWQALEK